MDSVWKVFLKFPHSASRKTGQEKNPQKGYHCYAGSTTPVQCSLTPKSNHTYLREEDLEEVDLGLAATLVGFEECLECFEGSGALFLCFLCSFFATSLSAFLWSTSHPRLRQP